MKTRLLAVCIGLLAAAVRAATFVVDDPGDSGVGTLRDAITNANASPGADTISFNIGPAAGTTITLASPLPIITEAVTIDGYTQPGASPNTTTNGNNAVILIELNGGILNGGSGLYVKSSDCVIRGLTINSFANGGTLRDGNAVFLDGGTSNVVEGCFFGTDTSGGAAAANARGVIVFGGTGNRLGTDGDGTGDAGERNLISGNATVGVLLTGGTTGNLIAGNFIGTDATGIAALGNGTDGVNVDIGATGNTLKANVISGNQGNGVSVADAGNVLQGNLIGTDLAGLNPVPNAAAGVALQDAGSTAIGSATGGNLISGNSSGGILLRGAGSTNNIIDGNLIGTDSSATAALPNGIFGIRAAGGSDNTIGGTGNVVAFNDGIGVHISSGTGNAILGNSIFGNASLGIDLSDDGVVTPNDPGDPDIGANNLQNFPVLTSAGVNGGNAIIAGTLDSEPSKTYRVEFFDSPQCDVSSNGQGQVFLGSTTVTTDAAGNSSFLVALPRGAVVGDAITATATDPANNTSEFSVCVPAVALVCATDITQLLSLRLGAVLSNLRTGHCRQRVIATNNSGGTLGAPIFLVLDALTPGVTLVNNVGVTTCAAPLGSPVAMISEPPLAPGQRAKILLDFANPQKRCIKYKPRLLTGPGTP